MVGFIVSIGYKKEVCIIWKIVYIKILCFGNGI